MFASGLPFTRHVAKEKLHLQKTKHPRVIKYDKYFYLDQEGLKSKSNRVQYLLSHSFTPL